jgi:hypothetical protein
MVERHESGGDLFGDTDLDDLRDQLQSGMNWFRGMSCWVGQILT